MTHPKGTQEPDRQRCVCLQKFYFASLLMVFGIEITADWLFYSYTKARPCCLRPARQVYRADPCYAATQQGVPKHLPPLLACRAGELLLAQQVLTLCCCRRPPAQRFLAASACCCGG